jgi:hypothetical protein
MVQGSVKGTYNGRQQAVCKLMILLKAPRLLLATTAPSSRERTTGARSPRLYRLRSTPLYDPVDDEGCAMWEYGAKSIDHA